MHALFFDMKRAYHSSLRIMRRPLHCHGLTAARFDLLWGIRRTRRRPRWQRDLSRLLGVTTPTVSRMLDSLEALGLVRTWRSRLDRRQRDVKITKRGLKRLRKAGRWLMKAAKLALHCALGGDRWWDENGTVFAAMCHFEDWLHCIREAYGDRARLAYPWHPDD